MRIVILSKYFLPSVGGLEAIAAVCLQEFMRQGHEVRLITESVGDIPGELRLPIFRRPSQASLRIHLAWAQVIFHNDAAVRYLPALLRSRRPYVVYMSGYIFPGSTGYVERITFRRRLLTQCFRLLLARASANIAACAAVASANQVPARITPNPFEATAFGPLPEISRTRDFIFAGRIVSLKGVDDLLRALAFLRDHHGLTPEVTVAGPGITAEGNADSAYGAEILALANELRVRPQLIFLGAQAKPELRRLFCEHRVFLIPSRWNEPIGIVCLEAIASGCVVIGTNGGGLANSIGPCGITYSNGDVLALAATMAAVLRGKVDLDRYRSCAAEHLQAFLPATVCTDYLAVLARAIENQKAVH